MNNKVNNNNNIRGEGGGLINFLPLKREGLLERGDLIEDLWCKKTKQTNKNKQTDKLPKFI